MSELTSAERVMRVLRREEPDRIPHFEWIIDHKVRDAIIPGCTMEEFTVRMGLDAILTAPDMKKERIAPNRFSYCWRRSKSYRLSSTQIARRSDCATSAGIRNRQV